MPTSAQTDPTRSIALRNAYRSAMRGHFGKLKTAIRDLVVKQDVFGLKAQKPLNLDGILQLNVDPSEWRFLTNRQKVNEFNQWLQEQMDEGVLFTTNGGDHSGDLYVQSAYKKGLVKSYIETNKLKAIEMDDIFLDSKDAFIRSSFGAPETASKLELLYTRAYESLKGVTAQMSSDMSRILTDGLVSGQNPRTIAKTMTDRIDRLTRTRAETIARTEVIHAHAEGQLDAFGRLGIETVGAEVEFSTAGDDRVCPICASLEGTEYTLDEARGIIPVHPNCRCAWLPIV